jgi:predicted naringenin-chalcone synthase
MNQAYTGIGDDDRRILRFLYNKSGIETRYSIIKDYSLPIDEWEFYPKSAGMEPFPIIEQRMEWYSRHACNLALEASEKCLDGLADKSEITHLITVSCTGMSAPGLELELMDALQLPATVNRSTVNFMGCYAAVHGLKQANDIVLAHPEAKVLMDCVELCTLHFQKTYNNEAILSPVLFGDGCAAVLITADNNPNPGVQLTSFYAEVVKDSKNEMTWNLSSTGFIMTLSAEVPDIFKADIIPLKKRALQKAGLNDTDIKYWCLHPGGKRILECLGAALEITTYDMRYSYDILRRYGNMSSPTILFVLNEIWKENKLEKGAHVFGAAFGPGLTMESMIMTIV